MAAKTYFCYGIPVTNESITLATMAYEQLDGPFCFIRLVQKRIRDGTLRTAQPSAVASIPIEIWDLVRHRVVDVELRAAEILFLDQHAPPDKWTELLHCDMCINRMIDYQGFDDSALAKKCRLLLRNYGLDLPSTRMLKTPQPGSWRPADEDPDSVAFVAVSPSSPPDSVDSKDHTSYKEPPVDDAVYQNDGIWPVSLDKPADADQRFRHLLRDLHLAPLKVSDGTIGIARADDPEYKRTYKKISADEVQPQWYLFTTVHCDWW